MWIVDDAAVFFLLLNMHVCTFFTNGQEVLPDRRQISEAEASPGKPESATTARNRDTSKPTAGHSNKKPTKLREWIRGVTGIRRSTTSAL